MTDWQRIELGEPKVLGINKDYSGLLEVDVPLTPAPDLHWVAVFDRGAGVPHSVSMHPPRLHGAGVRLRPPDAEVEAYMDALRQRVAATNDEYEQRILPALNAEAERGEEEAADQRRRVEDARKRLGASCPTARPKADGSPVTRT
jgi:hypothetical protein